MNPYREPSSVAELERPSRRKHVSWRRRVCIATVIAFVAPAPFYGSAHESDPQGTLAHMTWVPWLVLIALGAAVIGSFPVAETDVKARLCRILWRRGDRGTAFGVYIGWIPIPLSQKRMDRNERAVRRFVAQRRRERRL